MNHKKMKVMFLGLDGITFMACFYVIDLRLRILVAEDMVVASRRIWAPRLADRLLVATLAGFDGCEFVSAEIAFSDYPLFESFCGIFSKVPVYYACDCLRKHKMAISSILGGRQKILYIFS